MIWAIVIMGGTLVGGITLFIKTYQNNKKKIAKLKDEVAQHVADKAILARAVEQQSHAIHALEDVMKVKGTIRKEYKKYEKIIDEAINNGDADTVLASLNSLSKQP